MSSCDIMMLELKVFDINITQISYYKNTFSEEGI